MFQDWVGGRGNKVKKKKKSVNFNIWLNCVPPTLLTWSPIFNELYFHWNEVTRLQNSLLDKDEITINVNTCDAALGNSAEQKKQNLCRPERILLFFFQSQLNKD